MLKKRLSRLLFIIFIGLAPFRMSLAQEIPASNSIPLMEYLEQLQERFEIKFSYIDEELRPINITIPAAVSLEDILTAIRSQTQLAVKRLNERYYTITTSTTIDICARVLDNFEENNIPGASIEVLESDVAAVTDMDGSFSLTNIPRKAVLRIRHIGYKTKFVNAEDLVRKDPCKTLLMSLNYQQLEEVVLSQFLTTGLSKETDASIQFNQDEFGILPGLIEPDVLQTIQALPGIKSIDETVSDINIRGGTNDQNLILWDGIKMYQSGHFFGLISAFNPYLTEQITIIKNGTSARYGDGVSGIINMETKNAIEPQFFGGAGFNLISGDVYGQLPLRKNLGVQFSARRSVTDFLNTPTYSQFFDRAFQDTEVKGGSQGTDSEILREENFYFYDFTAKILYDPTPDQKIRLSFININNNLDYEEEVVNSGRRNISALDQTNLSFGGSLESQWSNRFKSRLNAYYTRYNLDAQNSIAGGEQILFQNNKVEESSFKSMGTYELRPTWHWSSGYQFTEVGITNFTDVSQPPFISNVKGVIRTHAVFSEVNHASVDNKINATAGVRLNYIENLGTFTEFIAEPRINLNYKFFKAFQLQLLGEFKNQTTNQIIDLEQNFLGIEKRRWILSDDRNLPITRSKQGSLGIFYDKKNWFLGIEGFYKLVDGISTSTQGFQNQGQFNGEIGKYDIKGVEFLINHKNQYFSTWLSYAYNDNNYTFEDITPSSFPNNLDIKHTITFASTYMYQGLKVGLGVNYRSGKPYTEPVEGPNAVNTNVFPTTINYQEPNSSRLPEYLRTDISAIYDFQLSPRIEATVGASVLNIFNKRNILNTYYRLNEQDEIETVESISLGLTPNFSFRVNF